MILIVSLVSITAGALVATAVCLAWKSGALEDERTRSTRLEEALLEERALVARITGGTDDIIRAARGAHRRAEGGDR